MNSKFEKLSELGAGEFEHLNGSLIKHLNSTYQILKKWGASQELCDSGLYHAAYGTAGFVAQVAPLSQRNEIAKLIGKAAEEIVYLYCSCDRDFVFSGFEPRAAIKFRDRFTKKEFELTHEQAQQFCELTVANELELAIDSTEFLREHGQGLYNLFTKMKPLLSKPANEAVTRVLGSVA
ncbi:hypothetical protein HII17_06175 [Thalassotalea sp. M1531]|uniref:DUF6817 domain-containing protein n=1 Tax=Thalassotalea algicola TaxID=2716224 RepID=A0A7Y0Q7K7_9GAMM|nr:hypothetical protein [Thalassotalea algicola]NMP31145.1 hypothetical protein [Thalassotalea algicola]